MQVKQRGHALKVCSYLLLLCPLLHRVVSSHIHSVMSEEEPHDPWDSKPTQGATRQKEYERMPAYLYSPDDRTLSLWLQVTSLESTPGYNTTVIPTQYRVSVIPGAETRRTVGARPCPGHVWEQVWELLLPGMPSEQKARTAMHIQHCQRLSQANPTI